MGENSIAIVVVVVLVVVGVVVVVVVVVIYVLTNNQREREDPSSRIKTYVISVLYLYFCSFFKPRTMTSMHTVSEGTVERD